MAFFDLNVPYEDGGGRAASSGGPPATKAARLRVVVKSMQLGYSGIALNKIVSDVSGEGRCKIVPFNLPSLLQIAPALSSTTKFHRELLGVPGSSTFRQYSRLTVAVGSVGAAKVFSSAKDVLNSYHLVAACPLNQAAFDHLCHAPDVDFISLHLTEKMNFYPKAAMIKAAIEKGKYFEINYSSLISDVQSRRQLLAQMKMIVDFTRGKNLILSSGAMSVNNVRGPYDIVNLTSLLGLSTEKAKQALSKNCSRLLTAALWKRDCYDGAIRVEKCLPGSNVSSKSWFIDWGSWDPISSGDGDLPSLSDQGTIETNGSTLNKSDGSTRNEISRVRVSIRKEKCKKIDGVRENFSETMKFQDNNSSTVVCEDSEVNLAEEQNLSSTFVKIDGTGGNLSLMASSKVQFQDNHESSNLAHEDSEGHDAKRRKLSSSMEIDDTGETVELVSDTILRSNPDEFDPVSISPPTEQEKTPPRTSIPVNAADTVCHEQRAESEPTSRVDSSLLSAGDDVEKGKGTARPNIEVLEVEDKVQHCERGGEAHSSSFPCTVCSITVSQEVEVSAVEEIDVEALNSALVFGQPEPTRNIEGPFQLSERSTGIDFLSPPGIASQIEISQQTQVSAFEEEASAAALNTILVFAQSNPERIMEDQFQQSEMEVDLSPHFGTLSPSKVSQEIKVLAVKDEKVKALSTPSVFGHQSPDRSARDDFQPNVTAVEIDLPSLPDTVNPTKVSHGTKSSAITETEMKVLKESFACGHQKTERRKRQHLPPKGLFLSKLCVNGLFFKKRSRHLNGSRQHSKRRNHRRRDALQCGGAEGEDREIPQQAQTAKLPEEDNLRLQEDAS